MSHACDGMEMTPEKPLHRLFNEALERQNPVERARYLDEACGADTALRARIERLLRADSEAGGFLSRPSEKPAAAETPAGTMLSSVSERAGDRIGRYKLLQQIGEGGCGVVYMAEQEEPVRRRVALKILKLGMDTKQVVARFEAERQALALMDHPNIAKVLDAGATESGRPFFVMELVSGVRITEFCDQRELSPWERLELFIPVCQAIQHAHQKGIIHRDLKPSNILVTTVDGTPMPKVIDFGIAKATSDQRLTDKTLFTAFEQFIGTPAYMSPEQAERSGVDIDTRTDIYSLGAVLYELLTGRTPFDSQQLLKLGVDQIRRTIREVEPAKPSTRLGTLEGDESIKLAKARKAEVPLLIRSLRGDLDWIVMKCLEKDRNRRYETTNALALDIRRFLSQEPVTARPPSRGYRFYKFVRRHAMAVGAATAVITALLLGTVFSTWQAVRATKAERIATRAAQEQRILRAEALLGQARELRKSGRVGQRYEALEIIRRAAQIQPGQELRNEAAAALAKVDLKLRSQWQIVPPSNFGFIGFDAELERYAEPAGQGFLLRAVSDQRIIRRFTGPTGGLGWRFVFSREGQRIAALYKNGAAEIWDIAGKAGKAPLLRIKPNPSRVCVDFQPGGTNLALWVTGRGVFLHNLEDNKERLLDDSPEEVHWLRLDPSGQRLAVNRKNAIEIWAVEPGARLHTFPVEDSGLWSAWSPDGHSLAFPSQRTRELLVLDAASGKIVLRFASQMLSSFMCEFHPDSRSVVSDWWDHTLRLWDARTGEQLLLGNCGPIGLRWSADGIKLAASAGKDRIRIYDVAPPTVFREYQSTGSAKGQTYSLAKSHDGRWLISRSQFVFRLWDTQAGAEVTYFPIPTESKVSSAEFLPGDRDLFYNLRDWGAFRSTFSWTAQGSNGPVTASLSTPKLLPGLGHGRLEQVSTNGHLWLVRVPPHTEIWENGDSNRCCLRMEGRWADVAMAPSGQWAAGADSQGTVCVWNIAQSNQVATLKDKGIATLWFSPDDRWLVGASRENCEVWQTSSWQWQSAWSPRYAPTKRDRLVFAAGGSVAAVLVDPDTVGLLSVPEGKELLRLEAPSTLAAEQFSLSDDLSRCWLLAGGHRLFEWNLSALLSELKQLGFGVEDLSELAERVVRVQKPTASGNASSRPLP